MFNAALKEENIMDIDGNKRVLKTIPIRISGSKDGKNLNINMDDEFFGPHRLFHYNPETRIIRLSIINNSEHHNEGVKGAAINGRLKISFGTKWHSFLKKELKSLKLTDVEAQYFQSGKIEFTMPEFDLSKKPAGVKKKKTGKSEAVKKAETSNEISAEKCLKILNSLVKSGEIEPTVIDGKFAYYVKKLVK